MSRSSPSGRARRLAGPALPLLLASLAGSLAAQAPSDVPADAPVETRSTASAPDTLPPPSLPRPAPRDGLLPGRAFWAGAGVALGGAALLDASLADGVPPGGGTRWEDAANVLNHLGRPKEILPVLAGLHVAGRLAGRERLADGTAHVVGALVAAGVVNGALKVAVGRERPGVARDPDEFRPIALDNAWQSFPSGHTVVAFSLATAAAAETDDPRVAAVGYATAALVGWSRVYEDKHWASDVAAGAVVGVVSTRAALGVLHRLDPHRPEDGGHDGGGDRRDGGDGAGPGARIAVAPGAVVVSIPVR